MMVSRARSPEPKIIGIEILRFGSALAILIWHYQHFFYVGNSARDFTQSSQPFFKVLAPLYLHGANGVELFWCISGFIFFWKYGAPIADRRIGLGRFALYRFSRLYPLHLLTLLLVVVLQQIYFAAHQSYFVYPFNDLRHFLLQVPMASFWGFEQGLSFNGPIWSISLEVLVYLFFFGVTRFLGASAIVTLGVASMATLAAYAMGASAHADVATHPGILCVALFYAGGLACSAFRWKQLAPGSRLLVVLVPLALLLAGTIEIVRYHQVNQTLAVVLGAPIIVYAAARYIQPSGKRLNGILKAAGNLTYSSYLLHFPLQLATVIVFTALGARIPVHSGGFFFAYLLVTLTLSGLTYAGFEMPVQNLIRRQALEGSRRVGTDAERNRATADAINQPPT